MTGREASRMVETEAWFQSGLRFQCTRCGACCTGVPGNVWVDDEDARRLARRLGLSSQDFYRRYTRQEGTGRVLVERENGDCVFFDRRSRSCTVYEDRPRQCRTWPFWPANVRTPQHWVETCQVCPGAGNGRLFSVEEILRAVSEVDPR